LNRNLYQILEFDKILEQLARRAVSEIGAERLRHLSPFNTADEAKRRLDEISELRILIDSDIFPIESFKDIRSYLKIAAIEGAFLDQKKLCDIHHVLSLVETMKRFFNQRKSELVLLSEIAEHLIPNPSLKKEIKRVLDTDTGEVLTHASRALARIRRELTQTRDQIRKKLDMLVASLSRAGVLQERFVTMRNGRWVLPIKETHRHLIRGIVHDQSASKATLFIEPLEILELNNRIRRLEAEERFEIENILRELTTLVRADTDNLYENLESLIYLDCVHAMAQLSRILDGSRPAINTEGNIQIVRGRHPLLLLRRTEPSDVVPLDLNLGEDFSTLVISGPNAGGKTVALKTVGLFALMIRCGLHIPASPDSNIAFFDQIYAHIGDDQSIEMALSTFSSHIQKIKKITERAKPGDLVLIDEIGSGTDPEEGAALGMSILEDLTRRGVITLTTTHLGSLKAFAHQTPGIANGSMVFDVETLTPTYRFRPGLPGSSYAFEIARRIGLSEDIVTRARVFMTSQGNRLEELVMELERQLKVNSQLEEELKKDDAELKELITNYRERIAKLALEADVFRQKAIQEASRILSGANAALEEAVRLVRTRSESRESVRQARKLIADKKAWLKKEIEASQAEDVAQTIGNVKPGDQVYWKRTRLKGTVIDPLDSTGRILIAAGNVRVRVPAKELSQVSEQTQTQTQSSFGISTPTPDSTLTEKDIRGMRTEEAIAAVDRFLNNAVLAGLKEVRIIHGIGTGALRKSINLFLKEHPLVSDTRQGGQKQENPGVTVVKICGA